MDAPVSEPTSTMEPLDQYPITDVTTCSFINALSTAFDMELIHVNVAVADADETIAFYEQFGFEESWDFETPDGETHHRYIADENGVELQLSETDGEETFEQGTAWRHLAIGVDDVDEVFEEISHHGVVKEPGDQPEAGARTAFVLDPDGREVELVEPLE